MSVFFLPCPSMMIAPSATAFPPPALSLNPSPRFPTAESEVRASVAFQVSRLAGLMAKGLRGAAKLEAWDGLVTGGSRES